LVSFDVKKSIGAAFEIIIKTEMKRRNFINLNLNKFCFEFKFK